MRVRNSVYSAAWPPMTFRPRGVVVGSSTPIRLTPHVGEFDGDALFTRRFPYERAVFQWLEEHAARRYDLIIEIGANVGAFTVFLDAITRQPNVRLKRVVAFEPSPKAYARLLANLQANGATTARAFNAAVAENSGFCTLFEPSGHLANGSLVADFARIFTEAVAATPTLAVAADAVDVFFAPGTAALIKIDVESYEPRILTALRPVLEKHRPDLIVEVLAGAAEPIEAALRGLRYDRFLLARSGVAANDRIVASGDDRDWLLQAQRSA